MASASNFFEDANLHCGNLDKKHSEILVEPSSPVVDINGNSPLSMSTISPNYITVTPQLLKKTLELFPSIFMEDLASLEYFNVT